MLTRLDAVAILRTANFKIEDAERTTFGHPRSKEGDWFKITTDLGIIFIGDLNGAAALKWIDTGVPLDMPGGVSSYALITSRSMVQGKCNLLRAALYARKARGWD